MKTVLIIGLGRFGHYLCKKMVELKNEVIITEVGVGYRFAEE